MESLANPSISLYTLSSEWGFSSCRHQEPILDSHGCQRGGEVPEYVIEDGEEGCSEVGREEKGVSSIAERRGDRRL